MRCRWLILHVARPLNCRDGRCHATAFPVAQGQGSTVSTVAAPSPARPPGAVNGAASIADSGMSESPLPPPAAGTASSTASSTPAMENLPPYLQPSTAANGDLYAPGHANGTRGMSPQASNGVWQGSLQSVGSAVIASEVAAYRGAGASNGHAHTPAAFAVEQEVQEVSGGKPQIPAPAAEDSGVIQLPVMPATGDDGGQQRHGETSRTPLPGSARLVGVRPVSWASGPNPREE